MIPGIFNIYYQYGIMRWHCGTFILKNNFSKLTNCKYDDCGFDSRLGVWLISFPRRGDKTMRGVDAQRNVCCRPCSKWRRCRWTNGWRWWSSRCRWCCWTRCSSSSRARSPTVSATPCWTGSTACSGLCSCGPSSLASSSTDPYKTPAPVWFTPNTPPHTAAVEIIDNEPRLTTVPNSLYR